MRLQLKGVGEVYGKSGELLETLVCCSLAPPPSRNPIRASFNPARPRRRT